MNTSRLTIPVLALCALPVWAQKPPAPAANAPTKAQRQELARTQQLRDSVVAARWNQQRQNLEERDGSQDEIEQLRDSLETAREEASGLESDARRQDALRHSSSVSTAPLPTIAPTDPLAAPKRLLQDRVRVLRDRVQSSLPWEREARLARVDAAQTKVATATTYEEALDAALAPWLSELELSRSSERRKGPLPRPEGDPREGVLLRSGLLGAWYAIPGDTSLCAALLRSGPAESPWEWREDLESQARQILSRAAQGQDSLIPLDPGTAPVQGPAFFREQAPARKLSQRLAEIFGSVHGVALWAARLVLGLLVLLGAGTLAVAVSRHRSFRREETTPVPAPGQILTAMRDPAQTEKFLSTLPSGTVAGRMARVAVENSDWSPEALEQILTAQESSESRRLEKGLGFMGSVGSNAPFIGLFGTVCGILDAFAALGQSGGGPQAVMSAIAEALIATAVGLFVAIPAIWLYNSLQGRLKDILDQARELRTLMLAASLEAAARRRD